MSSGAESLTRRRLLFSHTLSNATRNSVTSIRTILPEYSMMPPLEEGSETDEVLTLSNSSLRDSEHDSLSSEHRTASPSPQLPLSTASSNRHVPLDTLDPIRTILAEYSITPFGEGNETDEVPALSNLSPRESECAYNFPEQRPLVTNNRQSAGPPRYSTILTTPRPGAAHHIEHSFPLRGGHKSWATLYTFTPESVPFLVQEHRAAKPHIPRFLGGGDITGMLELNLEGTQTIQQIIITIEGTIFTGSFATEIQKFLHYEHVIWHKSMGGPRQLPILESTTQKSDGKMTGSHQFSFSFPFPAQIDPNSYSAAQSMAPSSPLAAGNSSPFSPSLSLSRYGEEEKLRPFALDLTSVQQPSASPLRTQLGKFLAKRRISQSKASATTEHQGLFYPTPASFSKRDVAVSVQYELLVRIVHGRFRPESKINTNISYLPIIVPPPFSLKRRQACEANAPIPGPMQDPEGWFALPKSVAKGKLDRRRQVEIDCKLHLAKPLSYTRGTVIPCYLELSGDDRAALSSLSTPKSPYVRLMCRLQHLSPHGGTKLELSQCNTGQIESSFFSYIPHPPAEISGKASTLNVIEHEIGVAIWWVPPKDVLQDPYIRLLEGEMHLPSDLQPSSSCPLFLVEYFVEMLPFVAGFEPEANPNIQEDPRKRVLSSSRVEIATSHCPGPIPVAFTKPSNSAHSPRRSSGSGSRLDIDEQF